MSTTFISNSNSLANMHCYITTDFWFIFSMDRQCLQQQSCSNDMCVWANLLQVHCKVIITHTPKRKPITLCFYTCFYFDNFHQEKSMSYYQIRALWPNTANNFSVMPEMLSYLATSNQV